MKQQRRFVDDEELTEGEAPGTASEQEDNR
jgi:hypothetical protein